MQEGTNRRAAKAAKTGGEKNKDQYLPSHLSAILCGLCGSAVRSLPLAVDRPLIPPDSPITRQREGDAMTRALSIALLALSIVAAAPPDRLAATLSGTLKDLLLGALPAPLFEDAKHWNLQHKNLFGHLKNDGKWWKLRVEATDPKNRLIVDVRDLQQAGKSRQTFNVHVEMDAKIFLERQTWLNGLRLY